jgi:hypothetical protein
VAINCSGVRPCSWSSVMKAGVGIIAGDDWRSRGAWDDAGKSQSKGLEMPGTLGFGLDRTL